MNLSQRSLKTAKEELRKRMKEERKGLSGQYCSQANQGICLNLKSTKAYKKSQMIFCYVSFDREADTKQFIQDALREGKHVAVPRCQKEGQMEAFEIIGLEDLEKGFCGILEPKNNCVKIEPDHLDLCVIPCIACTKEGIRLGYGGGYYDRYLPKTHALRALLCQEKMVCQQIPTESHDCPMDMIITENQAIFC